MKSADVLTFSVVVCAYTEDRWMDLQAAVNSIRGQGRASVETIVVIDNNPELFQLAREKLDSAQVVENAGESGLSSARNTGVAKATGEVVAFLDDDAVADGDWIEELARAYERKAVIGAGGVVRPQWEDEEAPRWLPEEFYWTVGCSYRGLPSKVAPIRNPIGANMSFRREAFSRLDGFNTGIGRLGSKPLGCEETEFSIRVLNDFDEALILYVPDAGVSHYVPRTRTTWSYFRSRCWSEGLSKAIVAEFVGQESALSSEASYAMCTLSTGVLRNIGDTVLRRDGHGVLRAAAIAAGLLVTTAGYLYGRIAAPR